MRSLLPLPLAAFALLAGCGEPQPFRAETELRPDGTVARSVQQTDLGGTDGKWDGTRRTRKTSADDWREPIDDQPADEEGGAMTAWGLFASAAAVPDHVRDGDDEPTRLSRTPEIVDHHLFTEYRWTETVLPGTDLRRAEVARAALVRELAPLLGDVLRAGLPPGTNPTPLVRWLETTGDAFTADALRISLTGGGDDGGDGAENDPGAGQRSFARLVRAYGLDLIGDDGAVVEDEALHARIEGFLEELVRSRVLTADGGALDESGWRRVRALFFMPVDPPADAAERHAAREQVRAIWERVVDDRYGSSEAFRAELEPLVADLFGGGFSLWGERREFVYRHAMPGVLLETNGTVLAAGDATDGGAEALFRFDFADAFPDGRSMTARSARADAEAQTALLGTVRVDTAAEIVEFLALLDEPGAARAWRRCRATGETRHLRGVRGGSVGRLSRLLLGGDGSKTDVDDPGAAAPPASG